jgi:hypothetical protein
MPQSSVKLPDGRLFTGPDVAINEQTERWSEIMLEDGSKLRVKPNVVSVIRVEGQWDSDGHPLYAIKSNIIMTVVDSPAHLKRGAAATTGRAN